jgi:acyl-coenzyme A synthetase/AMP-(fatty) acid ligase
MASGTPGLSPCRPAIIVPKQSAALDEAPTIAWAGERIGGFKVPKSVYFVATLPRNATGKVLRRMLRERCWAGQGRRVG